MTMRWTSAWPECLSFCLLLLLVGCGAREASPPAPQTSGNASSSTVSETKSLAEQPAELTKSEAPADRPDAKQSSEASAKRGDVGRLSDNLRIQLKSLVVPAPAGRWRVEETIATELEKHLPAIDELVQAVQDQDPAVRRGAWHLFANRVDPGNQAHDQLLRAALEDQDDVVRALAFRVVGELPEQQLPAFVLPLAQLLAREQLSPENRATIARLLGRLKSEAKQAEGAVADAARNDNQPKVRAACLVTLFQIAEPPANLPRFRAALQDPDAGVRVVAAARLREMGPAAADAAESLGKSLEDRDERVREAAAEALLRIGEASVMPLRSALASMHAEARRWAVYVLAKLGPVAKSAVGDLERRSKDEQEIEETRKMAALAVKRLNM